MELTAEELQKLLDSAWSKGYEKGVEDKVEIERKEADDGNRIKPSPYAPYTPSPILPPYNPYPYPPNRRRRLPYYDSPPFRFGDQPKYRKIGRLILQGATKPNTR